MNIANAAVSPQCPTGAQMMPVRLPRPSYLWRFDADQASWTGERSPGALNGTRRVLPSFHRQLTKGSVPGSNPKQTGWRFRSAKPDRIEWGVFGDHYACFWTSAAVPRFKRRINESRAGGWGDRTTRSSSGLLPDECLAGSLRPSRSTPSCIDRN